MDVHPATTVFESILRKCRTQNFIVAIGDNKPITADGAVDCQHSHQLPEKPNQVSITLMAIERSRQAMSRHIALTLTVCWISGFCKLQHAKVTQKYHNPTLHVSRLSTIRNRGKLPFLNMTKTWIYCFTPSLFLARMFRLALQLFVLYLPPVSRIKIKDIGNLW